MLFAGVSSVQYAPGYTDFTYLVNGSWLNSPKIPGYGAETWTPIIAETAMWHENFTGKAMVMDRPIRGKSPQAMIEQALKQGYAKGYGKPKVIFSVSPAGVGGFGILAGNELKKMKWVKVPVVDISFAVFFLAEGISKAGYPVKLAFLVRDDDQMGIDSDWPFAAVLISAALLTSGLIACFIVNGYKFFLHLKYTRGITTAKIFFVIDLLANFMRFWYVAVNPFFLARFGYTWTTICSATHVALSVICTLLLALKWRELLQQTKLKVTLFLTTFRWPFIIIAILIFLLEFVSSALRGHWFDTGKITQASTSILLILAFIIAGLLFVSGGQIMCHLSKAVGSKRRVWQLSRTTILILFSGIGLLLWASLQIAYLVTLYHTKTITIQSVQIYFLFGFSGLIISSLLQNWAMPFPSQMHEGYSARSTQSSRHSIKPGPITFGSKTSAVSPHGSTEPDFDDGSKSARSNIIPLTARLEEEDELEDSSDDPESQLNNDAHDGNHDQEYETTSSSDESSE